MTDPTQIAAKLSKAQREAVKAIVGRAIRDVLRIHYDPVLGQGMGGFERRKEAQEEAESVAADRLEAILAEKEGVR